MSVEDLRKKRGNIKGQVTRADTFLKKCVADPSQVNLLLVKVKLDGLEKYFEKFCTLQDQIEDSTEADQYDAAVLEREEVEELYVQIKSGLIQILSQGNSDPGLPNPSPNPIPQSQSHVKLPPLKLPTFSGKIQEWTSFSDLFTALVDSKTSLTGAQKLQYLKTCLQGDAAAQLHATSITDANYSGAWQSLKTRYENKRLIVNSHLMSIFNQSTLKAESPSDLRKLVDTTKESIRSLEAIGEPTVDSILSFNLCKQLDPTTRREWELEFEDGQQKPFEDLLKFLETRCQALDASACLKQKNTVSQGKDSFQKPRTSSYVTTSSSTQSQSCGLCGESHFVSYCPSYQTADVKQRTELVRKHKLCFNCLRKGHSIANCLSSGCRKCQRKHHTTLHYEVSVNSSSNSTEQKESKVKLPETTDVASLSARSLKSTVLLMTAMVSIKDHSGQFHPCRLLIDNGSQASFISENLVALLGLKRRASQVEIQGIGHGSAGKTKAQSTALFVQESSPELLEFLRC